MIYSSWALLKDRGRSDGGHARHIDLDEVQETIRASRACVPCTISRTITSGMVARAGHAIVEESHYREATLPRIREPLHERFGIDQATLQLETEGVGGELLDGDPRGRTRAPAVIYCGRGPVECAPGRAARGAEEPLLGLRCRGCRLRRSPAHALSTAVNRERVLGPRGRMPSRDDPDLGVGRRR